MHVDASTGGEERGERCSIRRAARDQLVTNNFLVLLDGDDMNEGNTRVRLLFGSSSILFFFVDSRDVFYPIDRENRENRSSIRVRDQVSLQAFWEDQKRQRMGCSIESRFLDCNDQRLFDQKAIDVAVTPHDTEILPVHLVTGTFFVF